MLFFCFQKNKTKQNDLKVEGIGTFREGKEDLGGRWRERKEKEDRKKGRHDQSKTHTCMKMSQ
jgi:hypothetical protein